MDEPDSWVRVDSPRDRCRSRVELAAAWKVACGRLAVHLVGDVHPHPKSMGGSSTGACHGQAVRLGDEMVAGLVEPTFSVESCVLFSEFVRCGSAGFGELLGRVVESSSVPMIGREDQKS